MHGASSGRQVTAHARLPARNSPQRHGRTANRARGGQRSVLPAPTPSPKHMHTPAPFSPMLYRAASATGTCSCTRARNSDAAAAAATTGRQADHGPPRCIPRRATKPPHGTHASKRCAHSTQSDAHGLIINDARNSGGGGGRGPTDKERREARGRPPQSACTPRGKPATTQENPLTGTCSPSTLNCAISNSRLRTRSGRALRAPRCV